MKQDDRFWPTVIVIALVVTIGVIAAVAITLYAGAEAGARESMRIELFKHGLQLGVVIIVGGGIALLYKWLERGWDERRELAERRKHYVTRLGDAYRNAREARRRLRACGVRGDSGRLTQAQVECLDEQMARISAEQLALEALRIESEHFPPTGSSTGLTSEVRAMERYLRRIVDEYERYRPVGAMELEPMMRLRELTCGPQEPCGPIDARAGTMQENFVKPHYRAISLIAR